MIIRDFEIDVAYSVNSNGYNSDIEMYILFKMVFSYYLNLAHAEAIDANISK